MHVKILVNQSKIVLGVNNMTNNYKIIDIVSKSKTPPKNRIYVVHMKSSDYKDCFYLDETKHHCR